MADEELPPNTKAPPNDKCATCVYFFPQFNKECRFNPPQVVHEKITNAEAITAYRRWPRVEPDDWCGFYSLSMPATYNNR